MTMEISSNITGHTCTFDDGSFIFKSGKKICNISIGNSLENQDGGIGGFAGARHEYFIYCGKKYVEIAIAKLRARNGPWESKGGYQGDEVDKMFHEIWSSKANPNTIYIKVVKRRASLMPFIEVHLPSFKTYGIIPISNLGHNNLSKPRKNQLYADNLEIVTVKDLTTILDDCHERIDSNIGYEEDDESEDEESEDEEIEDEESEDEDQNDTPFINFAPVLEGHLRDLRARI